MPDKTFFEVSAQVLPVLLLALLVESNTLYGGITTPQVKGIVTFARTLGISGLLFAEWQALRVVYSGHVGQLEIRAVLVGYVVGVAVAISMPLGMMLADVSDRLRFTLPLGLVVVLLPPAIAILMTWLA